jgi:hypothetical protein
MAQLGVPVKLLHESLGHIITVELKTGEVSVGVGMGVGRWLGWVVWTGTVRERGRALRLHRLASYLFPITKRRWRQCRVLGCEGWSWDEMSWKRH